MIKRHRGNDMKQQTLNQKEVMEKVMNEQMQMRKC